MSKFLDLTGHRYGKLVVLERASTQSDRKHPFAYWKCVCDCGNEKICRADFLRNGSFHSCGSCPVITDEGEYMKYTDSSGRFFIFDREDLDIVKLHRWNVSNHDGHVDCSTASGELFILTRLLMNLQNPDETVTHLNGNIWDNRKSNLRICDRVHRDARRKLYATNTTGYKGVSRCKDGKYVANIRKDKKTMYLGHYDTAKDAAKAYDAAAIGLFGEFALTNEELIRRSRSQADGQ